jgi:hypothetical protein
MEEIMKAAIATTFAAALVAASSLAFAADTGSGDNKDGMKQDPATTGSVNENKAGVEMREDCRDGMSGGAPCQEPGTTMDQ